MGAPKYKPSQLASLYQEQENLRDKQKIEALKKRLNQKFLEDPKLGKKAALILEQWLSPKKK